MAIKWINHQGKKILCVDYRDCKTEQAMIDLLAEEARILTNLPGKTRAINDFTGTSVGSTYMEKAKQWGKEVGIKKLERNAFLGISGLKTILVQGYLRATGDENIQVFDTEEKALAWLLSD